MPFYSRKSNRLPGYDYSSENYYFLTICTHNKQCIFGKPKELNALGEIAKECIEEIPRIYSSLKVDHYIVMPNHIHMILVLEYLDSNDLHLEIPKIIGQYKMAVSKKIHKIFPNLIVWQRSFHDHIIRSQQAYEKIWNYVEYNDQKWEDDCFYYNEI